MTEADFLPLIIFVVVFVFWGYMVRDLFQNPEIPRDQLFVWVIAFLFFSFPTAIFYYFAHYRKRQ